MTELIYLEDVVRDTEEVKNERERVDDDDVHEDTQHVRDNKIDFTNYSDYNLLFDEDTSLLGNGFHSSTTTTQSRLDAHPRFLIYYLIMAGILVLNFLLLAKIWIVIIDIIIHTSILPIAVIMELCNKNKQSYSNESGYSSRSPKSLIGMGFSSEQIEIMHTLSTDQLPSPKNDHYFKHSYTNAINYLFDFSNTYQTLPEWSLWGMISGFLYIEIILLIILAVWGSETPPGQYCATSYPDGDDPDFENGGCFIQQQVSLLFGVGAFAGIIGSLGSLYDISVQSMISIELAKKKMIKLFNRDIFKDDYFLQIQSERKRLIIPLRKKKWTFFWVIVFIIFWSFHCLWWEPRLLFKVKQNLVAVIILYILTVIGLTSISYGIVDAMHSIKNVYKDYWVIMQTLARPLRIKSIDDIRPWMEIRKLYMNYHMIIYFGCANGIVSSYVVIEIISILILIYWEFFQTLHIFAIGTLAVVTSGFVFTLNLLYVLSLCAQVSESKTIHVRMLQQEKQRLAWKINNQTEDNESLNGFNKTSLQEIDSICEHITKFDKSPKILGIPMTWSLYTVMFAYAVSGVVSIVGAILLD